MKFWYGIKPMFAKWNFAKFSIKLKKKMCDKRWPHKSCADDDGEEGGTYDLG